MKHPRVTTVRAVDRPGIVSLVTLIVALSATTALAQGSGASPSIIVTAAVQASGNTGIGLRLTAQLVQITSQVAPYKSLALPLATSGGYVLTPAASAPNFTALCSLTNSNTMLECLLSPNPGPGWNNDSPLVLRVQLTAAKGDTATTLITYNGGPNAFVRAQIQAGTGSFPASGNSAPIYLSAQLVRNVINLSPIESGVLALSAFTLTEAAFSPPASFAACVLTNSSTMLECTLVPVGPTWGPGGPLVIRVDVTSVDGVKATELVQFRIN